MGASEQRYGYRPTPRLSANQVAEYLDASSTRRKSIICAARFPKRSVVAQYSRARENLVAFLNDQNRSLNKIAQALDGLARRERRPGASEWIVRDSRLSAEAINAFQRGYNRIPLPALECRAVNGHQPPLVFGPTKVSVTLDVTTHKRIPGGPKHVGGVVLLFSRGERSPQRRAERCKIIAGLVYTFCGRKLSALGEADRSICYALDVFNSKAYAPPGTFARKLRQVEDACEEIGHRWRLVPPPEDYDGPDPD